MASVSVYAVPTWNAKLLRSQERTMASLSETDMNASACGHPVALWEERLSPFVGGLTCYDLSRSITVRLGSTWPY